MKQDSTTHLGFLKLVEDTQPPCRSVDPETFYPAEMDYRGIARAKEVCSKCPIQTECLQFAYDTDDQWGVFGGLTPRERRQLARKRAA